MAGELWVNNGSYFRSANLSKTLRYAVQPLAKFRQFASAKDAAIQGKGVGD